MFGWQHHPTQKHDGFSVGHLRISNLTSSLAIFGCGKVKPYVLRINHGWHFRSNLLLFPPGSMHMFMANLLVQATCVSVKTHIAYNFDPCMVSCWLNSSWSSKANYGFTKYQFAWKWISHTSHGLYNRHFTGIPCSDTSPAFASNKSQLFLAKNITLYIHKKEIYSCWITI